MFLLVVVASYHPLFGASGSTHPPRCQNPVNRIRHRVGKFREAETQWRIKTASPFSQDGKPLTPRDTNWQICQAVNALLTSRCRSLPNLSMREPTRYAICPCSFELPFSLLVTWRFIFQAASSFRVVSCYRQLDNNPLLSHCQPIGKLFYKKKLKRDFVEVHKIGIRPRR